MFRAYQPSDLDDVLSFVSICLQQSDLKNYHPGDIVHWMSYSYKGEHLAEHIWLYEQDQQLIAVADLPIVNPKSYVLIMHPNYRGGNLETALLKECEKTILERLNLQDLADVTLEVNVADSDWARMDCLAAIGYAKEVSNTVVAYCALNESMSEPTLAEGYNIRSVSLKDAKNLAIASNGAFDSAWTEAAYLKVMNTAGFKLANELIVESPTGDIAAFLIVWPDPLSKTFLFEPVGCHKDYQREGLTKALMFDALQRMKQQAMKTALVGYDKSNKAAAKLYESVGFEVLFETYDYTKQFSYS